MANDYCDIITVILSFVSFLSKIIYSYELETNDETNNFLLVTLSYTIFPAAVRPDAQSSAI